jgi:hypothetical protein
MVIHISFRGASVQLVRKPNDIDEAIVPSIVHSNNHEVGICVEPVTLAFLTSPSNPDVVRLELAARFDRQKIVCANPFDTDLLEIALQGVWIRRCDHNASNDFFVTLQDSVADLFVVALWQASKQELFCARRNGSVQGHCLGILEISPRDSSRSAVQN